LQKKVTAGSADYGAESESGAGHDTNAQEVDRQLLSASTESVRESDADEIELTMPWSKPRFDAMDWFEASALVWPSGAVCGAEAGLRHVRTRVRLSVRMDCRDYAGRDEFQR